MTVTLYSTPVHTIDVTIIQFSPSGSQIPQVNTHEIARARFSLMRLHPIESALGGNKVGNGDISAKGSKGSGGRELNRWYIRQHNPTGVRQIGFVENCIV